MATQAGRPGKGDVLDYLVLGAGPAGLQLAYYLAGGGHRYRVLERSDGPGSFFERFPRSRNLISFNKVHTLYDDPELALRFDWNSLLTEDYSLVFKDFSRRLYPRAEELLAYLRTFAESHGLDIAYGTDVRRVARRDDGVFELEDTTGSLHLARVLVVATGTGLAYVPSIPGIEHAEGYESVDLDPAGFEGQRVLVVGKGNSGFEIAEAVLDSCALVHLASPTPLKMAWTSRHAGNVRGHYTRILDAYQLKMLHGLLDCTVDSIEARGDGTFTVTVTYRHAEGETECLVYDRVIRATGFCFDASIFDESARPELTIDERLPAMTSGWESPNVSGMFFAGNVMQVRDFRTASSPFIDGFRYNVRTLYHLLRLRDGGEPLPGGDLLADPHALAAALVARASVTSALWAQFGHLCDAVVVDETSGRARHYYELPADHLGELGIGRASHLYTLSFNWGRFEGDVFRIDRHPSHQRADEGVFLHPIVCRFTEGELVAKHHLLEDLLGMYSAAGEPGNVLTRGGTDIATYHREQHELPLRRFLEAEFARSHSGGYQQRW